MDRCEVAYNDDDLSDIFSWLGYTIQNAHGSDSAIFALAQPWEPGQELRIYDCRTLKIVGCSCIKSNTPCKDAAALEVRCCLFIEQHSQMFLAKVGSVHHVVYVAMPDHALHLVH